jgi:hypothetical protein
MRKELIGDASGGEWVVPGVITARVVGDLRVCLTANGQETQERLSSVEGEPWYRYEHLVTPAPVRDSWGFCAFGLVAVVVPWNGMRRSNPLIRLTPTRSRR